MVEEKITLVEYTKKQEQWNCITHAVGAAMGVAAVVVCVIRSLPAHSLRITLSGVIYGLSMIVMYTASAVYHGLPVGNAKRYARLIDHSMVFLIIAGTATPCALVTLYNISAFHCWLVFCVAWLSAVIGILSAVFFFEKSKAVRMVLYIGEGFVMITSVLPIIDSIDKTAYATLWLGCGVLLLGAVLFGLGRKYAQLHTVFHVFVLAGTAIHFYGIATYVFSFAP